MNSIIEDLNNNIDISFLFNSLEDYVVLKCNDMLPRFTIHQDIDFLVKDIEKTVNIIKSYVDPNKWRISIRKLNDNQCHVDLFTHESSKLILRFDIVDKLVYKKFSLHPHIEYYILKNRTHNGTCFVPCLVDDLSIRYCEYIEYINIRKDKIKHLNYVKKFDVDFYRIQENERNSLLNYNKLSIIHHSIIIWGHGLEYSQSILNNLQKEIDCRILNVKQDIIENIEAFIKVCYNEELHNINHILAKTNYLKTVPLKYLHVLVRNNSAEIKKYGSGAFETYADINMVNWKWKIRNAFNPKNPNVNKPPLKKGITHNHVIHVTDTESECQFLAKYVTKQNIHDFYDKKIHNFNIPWHISFSKYKLENVCIKKLKAMIIKSGICDVHNTPHYLYVKGEKTQYSQYYKTYCGLYLQDNHTTYSYDRLINNFNPDHYNFEISNLIIVDKNYIIKDGLHRACILYHHDSDKMIKVIRIF